GARLKRETDIQRYGAEIFQIHVDFIHASRDVIADPLAAVEDRQAAKRAAAVGGDFEKVVVHPGGPACGDVQRLGGSAIGPAVGGAVFKVIDLQQGNGV